MHTVQLLIGLGAKAMTTCPRGGLGSAREDWRLDPLRRMHGAVPANTSPAGLSFAYRPHRREAITTVCVPWKRGPSQKWIGGLDQMQS